jgi:hypothetical protein
VNARATWAMLRCDRLKSAPGGRPARRWVGFGLVSLWPGWTLDRGFLRWWECRWRLVSAGAATLCAGGTGEGGVVAEGDDGVAGSGVEGDEETGQSGTELVAGVVAAPQIWDVPEGGWVTNRSAVTLSGCSTLFVSAKTRKMVASPMSAARAIWAVVTAAPCSATKAKAARTMASPFWSAVIPGARRRSSRWCHTIIAVASGISSQGTARRSLRTTRFCR